MKRSGIHAVHSLFFATQDQQRLAKVEEAAVKIVNGRVFGWECFLIYNSGTCSAFSFNFEDKKEPRETQIFNFSGQLVIPDVGGDKKISL